MPHASRARDHVRDVDVSDRRHAHLRRRSHAFSLVSPAVEQSSARERQWARAAINFTSHAVRSSRCTMPIASGVAPFTGCFQPAGESSYRSQRAPFGGRWSSHRHQTTLASDIGSARTAGNSRVCGAPSALRDDAANSLSSFHQAHGSRSLTALGLVGACTVVDKGDYTFTDVPGDSGGESGSASGGTSGWLERQGRKGGTAGEGGDGSGGTTTGGTSGEAGGGGTGGDGGLCDPNPCENGGTCVESGSTTSCECADGYEGVTCEDEIDECDPNPCMDNAPCTDLVADFSCACPPPVTESSAICRISADSRAAGAPEPADLARAVSADGTIVLGAVKARLAPRTFRGRSSGCSKAARASFRFRA